MNLQKQITINKWWLLYKVFKALWRCISLIILNQFTPEIFCFIKDVFTYDMLPPKTVKTNIMALTFSIMRFSENKK